MESTPMNLQTSEHRSASPFKSVWSFLKDGASGLGMDMNHASPILKRQIFQDVRNTESRKRPVEHLEQLPQQRAFKRHRSFDVAHRNESSHKSNHLAMLNDMDGDLTTSLTDLEGDIFGDNSDSYTLPTIEGKHRDLRTISPETMQRVLSGYYCNTIDHVTVIDCRYPYEYQAGHILNAINIYSKDGINKFLTENTPSSSSSSSSKHVLIFHCEFSSKRGPKLCRFLRSQDRDLNKDNYPKLDFPEIYLLEGGYKQFYETNKDLCFPQAYKPMLDKQHSADLRHFRVKSKSWAAGDKPKYKEGLQRLKLSFN